MTQFKCSPSIINESILEFALQSLSVLDNQTWYGPLSASGQNAFAVLAPALQCGICGTVVGRVESRNAPSHAPWARSRNAPSHAPWARCTVPRSLHRPTLPGRDQELQRVRSARPCCPPISGPTVLFALASRCSARVERRHL